MPEWQHKLHTDHIAHRLNCMAAHTDKLWILLRPKAALVFKLKQIKSNLNRGQNMTYDQMRELFWDAERTNYW